MPRLTAASAPSSESRDSGLTARVPVTPELWAVWKRYCDMVGVSVGGGLAVLVDHELASVIEEEVETLTQRVQSREAAIEARDEQLAEREEAVAKRERYCGFQERQLESRIGGNSWMRRNGSSTRGSMPSNCWGPITASLTNQCPIQARPQPGLLVQLGQEVQELSS